MHRRIKSKNRKKLKPVDPFNPNAHLATKTSQKNLPPKDDEQETPRSFRELFLDPQNSVDGAKKRKKKPNRNVIEGYERKPWETDKQFLNRVQRSTHDYVNDQLTKIKYGLVGFEPTDVLKLTEETKKNKRRRPKDTQDDTDEQLKSTPKKKQKFGDDDGLQAKQGGKSTNKSKLDGPQQSADAEKKAGGKKKVKRSVEKRREKKKQQLEDEVDPLYMREVIPFGDRVDEPPHLTALPKKAKKSQQSKAGSKDLLLKKQLESAATFTVDKKRYENDGTIKCDDAARQRLLEEERRRVIEAYRSQKKRARERRDS